MFRFWYKLRAFRTEISGRLEALSTFDDFLIPRITGWLTRGLEGDIKERFAGAGKGSKTSSEESLDYFGEDSVVNVIVNVVPGENKVNPAFLWMDLVIESNLDRIWLTIDYIPIYL